MGGATTLAVPSQDTGSPIETVNVAPLPVHSQGGDGPSKEEERRAEQERAENQQVCLIGDLIGKIVCLIGKVHLPPWKDGGLGESCVCAAPMVVLHTPHGIT
jgi:hypothetical protein